MDHHDAMDERPTFVSASELTERLNFSSATQALHAALTAGFDPADDLWRRSEPLAQGAMLLMPSEGGGHAGIKVLTMAPGNPQRGLDLIQGAYLLFDGETLALTHVIDGPALTDLRTPAMTMAALQPAMERFDRPVRVVVFGAGHQGRGHAEAARQVWAGEPGLESVTVLVRHPDGVRDRAFDTVVAAGSPDADTALREADVVLCATPAATPLFDSGVLRDDVVVGAVGSHTPEARELDGALMGRAEVIVEDRVTALRECGDVIQAIADGHVTQEALVPIADVVTGRRAVNHDRPYVFKGSGMPWQDLVVASAAVDNPRN